MQAYLKKHGPGFAGFSVKFQWQRNGSNVDLDFQVQKRLAKDWVSDPVFTGDWSKNWGLWNKDVVEAFLQLRSHPEDINSPYLELQISPLNQPFALIIKEPRKTFFAPQVFRFDHEVSLTEKLWTGSISIELPNELSGEKLYGGFFACLSQEPREYFALEPNPELTPDFHRPELFLNLEDV